MARSVSKHLILLGVSFVLASCAWENANRGHAALQRAAVAPCHEERDAPPSSAGMKAKPENEVANIRKALITPPPAVVLSQDPSQVNALNDQIRQLNDQVRQLNDQIRQLNDKLRQAQQGNDQLKQKNDQLGQSIEQLNRHLTAETQELATAKAVAGAAATAALQAQAAATAAFLSAQHAIAADQTSGAAALAAASRDAAAAIAAASSAAAANLADALSSANQSVAAMLASASIAVQQAQNEAANAKAEAAKDVQRAQGAALSVTRTALAVMGAVVGSSLLSVVGFLLFLRRMRLRQQASSRPGMRGGSSASLRPIISYPTLSSSSHDNMCQHIRTNHRNTFKFDDDGYVVDIKEVPPVLDRIASMLSKSYAPPARDGYGSRDGHDSKAERQTDLDGDEGGGHQALVDIVESRRQGRGSEATLVSTLSKSPGPSTSVSEQTVSIGFAISDYGQSHIQSQYEDQPPSKTQRQQPLPSESQAEEKEKPASNSAPSTPSGARSEFPLQNSPKPKLSLFPKGLGPSKLPQIPRSVPEKSGVSKPKQEAVGNLVPLTFTSGSRGERQ